MSSSRNHSTNKKTKNALINQFPNDDNKKNNETFTSQDFNFLLKNEHFRYLSNSDKIAHAVIFKKADEIIAQQYAMQDTNASSKVCLLKNIKEMSRFGKTVYKAETDENPPITMYGKRFVQFKVNGTDIPEEETANLVCFSPRREDKEPFWGSNKTIKVFKNELSFTEKKDRSSELADIKETFKGGDTLHIDPESVRYREVNNARHPDQNAVMKASPLSAYQGFLETYENDLSDDFKKLLNDSIKAPLQDRIKSQKRPEWLSAYGFSLTPKDNNLQKNKNLGVAPKWTNTEMMVLERIAKWFALNQPALYVSIKPRFKMLLDSELIERIDFLVSIKDPHTKKKITFFQDIDPFIRYPLYRKSSDLAQATNIAHSLLQDVKPLREEVITHAAHSNNKAFNIIANANKSPTKLAQKSKIPEKGFTFYKELPTHSKHANSIVKIKIKSLEPDYDTPWKGAEIGSCSGTGFIIQHDDKKYIITNAHCVENARIMRVRFANETKHFEADVKRVAYQCDLALLEVDSPEFNQKAVPLKLGNMVSLQDEVMPIGFPIGGDEISISKGIVSRIEVGSYSMSGLDMLQVQIDAAVNPGNSGGPVLSNDLVVGVAFQGIGRHQGLNYMIPMPVVKHFLHEVFSNKPYHGFPELPIHFQYLKNDYQKAFYGLDENKTGIRIKKLYELSDVYQKLQIDDILLEIDSLKVSCNGKIDVPGIGNNINLAHVMHMKYWGDSISLKILRNNENTAEYEEHDVTIVLDCIPNDENKVTPDEHDKMPTFYIASGISFIPLTANYIAGKGAKFDEYHTSLAHAFKKSPDEQLIVINEILDCNETEGYESYQNKIVKKVNGIRITNIKDLITAIETNRNNLHHIKISNGNIMIVPKMTKHDHDLLLNRWEISRDCSNDLLSFRNKVNKFSNDNHARALV